MQEQDTLDAAKDYLEANSLQKVWREELPHIEKDQGSGKVR